MKNFLGKIIKVIINFFNRIIDKEAKRVDEFNNRVLGETKQGGAENRIKFKTIERVMEGVLTN